MSSLSRKRAVEEIQWFSSEEEESDSADDEFGWSTCGKDNGSAQAASVGNGSTVGPEASTISSGSPMSIPKSSSWTSDMQMQTLERPIPGQLS